MKGIDRKLHDKCGVFGIWNRNDFDTAHMVYYALYALQHRGQEGSGIAINDNGKIVSYKREGIVTEVFNEKILGKLKGKVAIGHANANTATEDSIIDDMQPLVLKYTKGHMALALNGVLVNSFNLRKEVEEMGHFFQTTSDSEILAMLISRERVKTDNIETAIQRAMSQVEGAYSFLVMTPGKLIGVRDPRGMRPLAIGKKDDSYVLASETSAFDTIGAEFIRDVKPGEIVIIQDDRLTSIQTEVPENSSMCIFEFVYIARTDSTIDGANVYKARYNAGRELAKECPVDADIVIGVPDSGLAAAMGYAAESGIPYAEGFIKNRYIGRTFIQPTQEMREASVSIKLNAIRSQVEGKRVIMIDDSIVRGTTCKRIVNLLRTAGGAKEVHVRISSPMVKYPCYFGVDIADKETLVANNFDLEGIRELIGADSLGFMSVEALKRAPEGAHCGFCTACFDNKYPIKVKEEN